MTRPWHPADAGRAIDRALASEAEIRAKARELVAIAHREPWKIGSVDAQQYTVARARERHTASVERTNALLVSQRTMARRAA